MKKCLLFIITLININVKAQILFEHKYDSASTYKNSQLMIIKFEVSGEQYVKINKIGKIIDIYSMNHSLVKTISYASFPQACSGIPVILYISEKLFDTDSQIEFMYNYSDCAGYSHTKIYKENGAYIFSSDSLSALITVNVPLQQYPIYNTLQGTKMILSNEFDSTASVYSLPGTLNTAIQDANGQLMQMQGWTISNLYPNPALSGTKVTLQYELPKGETAGEIILYNLQGAEVKRYKVDNTFNDLILDNSTLPAGTYYWHLQTSAGVVGSRKMVVVK